MLNVYIARHDTTGTTMLYAFLLLLIHPKVYDALRIEIDNALGKDPYITRAHIRSLPSGKYVIISDWRVDMLRMHVSTSITVYPPVLISTHFCTKTTTLPFGGGPDGVSPLLVCEGMPVVYSVYHMQRRKDLQDGMILKSGMLVKVIYLVMVDQDSV